MDYAGYFLYCVRDGAELIDRVGSPNVKILFDIYHVQLMEGNLIHNIRSNIDRIGHFHVGDVPGRHEPGTGEINYRNVFKAIYDLGDRFRGSAALEYHPLARLEENLAAMRQMANFAWDLLLAVHQSWVSLHGVLLVFIRHLGIPIFALMNQQAIAKRHRLPSRGGALK